MKKMIIALAIATAALASPVVTASAANVPCEDMLKTLRTAEAGATLTADQKAKVSDLEAKGIERCNADDDKRADDFFSQAMTIMGK